MPWSVKKDSRCGSGYAVVKDSNNEVIACHKSKKSAVAQQRALYASEAKTAKASTMDMPYVSDTAGMPDVPDMPQPSDQADEWDSLTDRQQDQAEAYFEIVLEYGMFNQSSKADGAHYAPASANPFKATGLMCGNCVFFNDNTGAQCMIVEGMIEPEAVCKMWIIPEEKIIEPTAKSNNIWAGRFVKLNK
jgi:hypothetical protein